MADPHPSLGDFIRQLLVLMDENKIVMKFKDETPWHLLVYRLKKEAAGFKPSFLSDLRFDWDGPQPKCQELSEFIQALHWTGTVVAVNPSYERILLQDDVKELWKQEHLETEFQKFLQHSVELAKEEFPTLAQ